MSTTGETMLAWQFDSSSDQPVQKRVPIPVPAPDEVLVKVLAGGVCHSDVMVLEPTSMSRKAWQGLSFTLGHEGSGIVAQLGSAVATNFPEITSGTYVGMLSPNACHKSDCRSCGPGYNNLCLANPPYGLGKDGFWAPYVAIRAACVVPVPKGPEVILPGIVAAATDAVLTPWHAIKALAREEPGRTVLCYGIGGLGLNGVAIAKNCFGAKHVIACDLREEVLEDARAFGADYTATPAGLLDLIRTNKLSVDFAFDFVGSQETFDICFSAVRMGGTIHVLGVHARTLTIIPMRAMAKDLTYKTSFIGTKDDLGEVLKAIASGSLKPKVETRSMNECVQVLDDMRAGKLRARIALIPEVEQSSL